jgi:hypothetical protein
MFVGESIPPKSNTWSLSRCVSRRTGYDPRACGQSSGCSAGSTVFELDFLSPEVTQVHRSVLDLVSAGGDDLPDPFLPKRRDGMASSQVVEDHTYQTFVVVSPQSVAAIA